MTKAETMENPIGVREEIPDVVLLVCVSVCLPSRR